MAVQPFRGATTAQFYVPEVIQGVTPTSPSWRPLRSNSGIPSVTRDALVSAELDGGREVSSIRTGNEQVAGEYSIELSQSSQDDLLAAAMTSDWVAGETASALSVTVDATAKTFTRAAGSFITDGVEIGALIYFEGLTGNNSKPFFVTNVTALVVTGSGIQLALEDETGVTTDFMTGDKLETGNLCKSVSILTWFKGKCGNPDAYVITRGVEFTGFTIEQAVNAMVTGSLPFIGLSQEVLAALPAGSTFTVSYTADPFASVDVSLFDGVTPLKLVDSFTITNDNEASAQFELGNRSVAFVERGRAMNTFSMAAKLYDLTMLNKFLDETDVEVSSILSGVSGAMSFSLHAARITAAPPEISGSESVTLAISGQATGSPLVSSITIQRLTYP
ncbi:major tail protein [Shewanella sp. phage 3/49]|uniref:major tail protein n=1 Tax=Shewanella sp. phage 3/49 TaxID=1458863 RepID=UPI0004F680D5|nr:major tail protein [Shewanella sp. phage 3/49]AHK11824.1 major tail protein [Shewanella sp. phage 3/49]